MRVGVDQIFEASRDALLAHGAGKFQATEVARAIARAEQTGNIICGLYYLESYCLQLVTGRVKGQVDPVVTASAPGAILSDAAFGFAQPAFTAALSQVEDAARMNGVATLSVAHSHTCTSLGYFTEQIASRGLIGIGFTNASAIVSAPAGKSRLIGTNPMAFTVPGPDGPALHADFSTAAVALGKITMAKAAGEAIPLGWAVDRDGNPTIDPEAALSGSLLSAAGPKGWALGLLVEVLAAGMTGSVGSLDVMALKAPDGPPHDLGQFYILIDPSRHGGAHLDRLGRIAEAMAADEGVRIPGSRRPAPDHVEIDSDIWALAMSLGGGPATN